MSNTPGAVVGLATFKIFEDGENSEAVFEHDANGSGIVVVTASSELGLWRLLTLQAK